MSEYTEKRREKRLRYHWPVWYGNNFEGILSQGQMVDVSSGGAAFTCYNDNCPYIRQAITAILSIRKHTCDESFDMENYVRGGKVCRVQEISPFIRRVAVQFEEVLPFKPGEQTSDTEELEAVLN